MCGRVEIQFLKVAVVERHSALAQLRCDAVVHRGLVS